MEKIDHEIKLAQGDMNWSGKLFNKMDKMDDKVDKISIWEIHKCCHKNNIYDDAGWPWVDKMSIL